MKARIINKGEIVELHEWHTTSTNPFVTAITFLQGGNFVKINGAENFELINELEPDWEQRRWDASVAAMQGLCAAHTEDGTWSHDAESTARQSVYYAKSLIEEFKKQQKL